MLLFLTVCFLLSINIQAQQIDESESAYVIFNLGSTVLKHAERQPLSLYGCNTTITIDSLNGFKWNTINQVLSNVPFGYQPDTVTNGQYYVSKYYIASPPVFEPGKQNDLQTIYDIGIVTPDNFQLRGIKPVQAVYMNYSVLKPMFIEYIEANFGASFEELGVSLIPFKVESKNFPWINTQSLMDAQGATGVGAFHRDKTNKARLFLPYYYSGLNLTEGGGIKEYLDFEISILNDILFHYEVYFVIEGKKHTTINLTEMREKQISFIAEFKEELPEGCKK